MGISGYSRYGQAKNQPPNETEPNMLSDTLFQSIKNILTDLTANNYDGHDIETLRPALVIMAEHLAHLDSSPDLSTKEKVEYMDHARQELNKQLVNIQYAKYVADLSNEGATK
jgi:hypothetical protein